VAKAEATPEYITADFVMSSPDLKHCPRDDLPEVAFCGRSNAGKSSVLNRIANNKGLAKVSRTPGRTRLINFFNVKTGGRIADLPGYGYAKAGKTEQQTWQKAVNRYLSLRENLVGLVLITDIRHPDQPLDNDLLKWAIASQIPVRLLLNKSDKISKNKQAVALKKARERFMKNGLVTTQTFSALKGTGTDELNSTLHEWLSSNPNL
tara:strand:+ start:914 stop:1534 length:621 start_codon:yes stop_codon:yes gene_type:complete